MADVDVSKLSDKELMALVNQPSSEEKSAVPEKRLEGRVEFSPEMEKRDAALTKEYIPQAGENPISAAAKYAMLPVRGLTEGAGQAGEDLANFVGGGAQQMAGVPQQNRMSVADLLRKINPGYVSSGEMERAPQFQQALQQNPVVAALYGAPKFVGGLVSPIAGGATQLAQEGLTNVAPALARMLPGAAARVQQAIPAIREAAGAGAPVANYAKNLMSLAQDSQAGQILQKLGVPGIAKHIGAGAISGGAYAPVFSAGARFGAHRDLGTAQQAASDAGTGAAFGGALGAGSGALQNMMMRARIKQLAQRSPVLSNKTTAATAEPIDELPDAKLLKTHLKNAMYQIYAGKGTLDEKAKAMQFLLSAQHKRFQGESPEHDLALTEAAHDFEKMNFTQRQAEQKRLYAEQQDLQKQQQKIVETQDKRQYAEQTAEQKRSYAEKQAEEKRQQAEKDRQARTSESRGYKEGQTQQGFGLNEEHAKESGTYYDGLAGEIENAQSEGELNYLRNEIFNPGISARGKRLLDSPQQGDLMSRWRERRNALREKENPPGEPSSPSAPTGGQQPLQGHAEVDGEKSSQPNNFRHENSNNVVDNNAEVDAKQPKAAAEPARENSPKMDTFPAEPDRNPVRTFIQGAFRKWLEVSKYGPRKERYKFAVSVEALGSAAGLSHAETTALGKWVSQLADARVELDDHKQRIKRLVEWAFANEDKWIGQQYDTKAYHATDPERENANTIILEAKGKEAKIRAYALHAIAKDSFESGIEQNLEPQEMNAERYGGEGVQIKKVRNAHVQVTTNGVVEPGDWRENRNGSLKVGSLKDAEPTAFEEPKSADEILDRIERLDKWRKHYENKLTLIKNAEGEYNHLEDGTRPVDVMQKAGDTLHEGFINGEAPNTHVWHVSSTGHVSTVNFVQDTWKDLGEARADLEARMQKVYDAAPKNPDGTIDYKAIKLNKQKLDGMLRVVTGFEPALLAAAIAGEHIQPFASEVGKVTGLDYLFAGTIRNILADGRHARFGGDEINSALSAMEGRILDRFFTNTAGKFEPVGNADDLASLLNQFKGEKLQRSSYRRKAQADLFKEKPKGEVTQEELDTANRRADTALMIRNEYAGLAKQVQERIDEMAIRKIDAESGIPSKEGRKYYTKEDIHEDGRVRKDAYSNILNEAYIELHKGLTLQPSTRGIQGINNFASRINKSILSNNIATAGKNIFDQLPYSAAHFLHHFFTGIVDYHSHTEYVEAINRLPFIAQNDALNTQMHEDLKDDRPVEGLVNQTARLFKQLNLILEEKLDPLFKGRSTLVGLPDHWYAKYSTMASFNKTAFEMGLQRHDFMDRLINNKFTPEERNAVFENLSTDLGVTINSVSPHINKDLFGYHPVGRLLNALSLPGRRNIKQLEGYLKSPWGTQEGRLDKLRFMLATFGGLKLAGRAAIPASIVAAYKMFGSATGQNEKVEQNLQYLDQQNALRAVFGIDYTNFAPDYLTNAAPALEEAKRAYGAAAKAYSDSDNKLAGLGLAMLSASTSLAVFPKIGPFGTHQWIQMGKRLGAAQKGNRDIYYQDGLTEQLHSVNIHYTYADAWRDFLLGGTSIGAQDKINEKRLNDARKKDYIFSSKKSIIPQKQEESALPPNA